MNDAVLREVMKGLPTRMLQPVPGLTEMLDSPHVAAVKSDKVPNPYAKKAFEIPRRF